MFALLTWLVVSVGEQRIHEARHGVSVGSYALFVPGRRILTRASGAVAGDGHNLVAAGRLVKLLPRRFLRQPARPSLR